jgi:hypothetical protein
MGFPVCTPICASGTGACVYPGDTQECGGGVVSCSNSDQIKYVCNGAGSCATMGMACLSGYLCGSTTACATSCGTTAGVGTCQTNYYCTGGMINGACKPQRAMGQPCTQNYMCLSGTCNMMSLTCM